AVVTLAGEDALAAARTAEREIGRGKYRGPLHGIPYGAKDLLATKKMPTTWGAAPYRDQQFAYDATVIRKLEAAGAVLAAKLAMALGWTLDKLGPLARGSEDCAIVLDAMAGKDSADPTTVDAPPPAPPPSRRMRIGVLKGATDFVQPDVAKNFGDSLAVLSRFADVTRDVALVDLPFGLVAGTIVDAEGGSAF